MLKLKRLARRESLVYKINEKGNFRNITAKLREDLKDKISAGLTLKAPLSVSVTVQRIELTFSIEGTDPVVKFKLNKEVNNISAIEALVAVAESLLENFKGA